MVPAITQFNFTEGVVLKKEEQIGPLLAEDLMSSNPFTLLEDDNLRVADEIMKWKSIRHIPVIDHTGKFVGLITDKDLLRASISSLAEISWGVQDALYQDIQAAEIMNKAVVTISPKTSISRVARLMYKNKFSCLPVLKKGELVGVITEADFIRFFMKHHRYFHKWPKMIVDSVEERGI